MKAVWLGSSIDPAWEEVRRHGSVDLDHILGLYPSLKGEPAFDPDVVSRMADALPIHVDVGHPVLDRSVRVGLAHIDLTFEGDHPKYGVKAYSDPMHDGFPPTIIAAVDALSAWGMVTRAEELWRYWLRTFVRIDGTIAYYGASLSEYGQLLHTGVSLAERGGDAQPGEMARLAEHVTSLVASRPRGDLVAGIPEADEADRPRRYFHNNAWLATGLRRWDAFVGVASTIPDSLALDTTVAIRDTWASEGWLSPEADFMPPSERPRNGITSTRLGSYTNYRYWPELLSSGILPDDMANQIVDARLTQGGQFCGVTRFDGWLDDWPLVDYLQGVWSLGRRDDFLLSLYGHVAYSQAEGHLTAYEQLDLPPGCERAPYCLPCQLVAPRAIAGLAAEGATRPAR